MLPHATVRWLGVPPAESAGAFSSFRMTCDAERTAADTAETAPLTAKRTTLASVGVVAMLAGVGSSAFAETLLDGEPAAVRIRQWTPLGVAVLLALLVGGTGSMEWLLPRPRRRRGSLPGVRAGL
eukprot:COSAG05_NODE_2481_length_3006_cov_849.928793_2_plen_125_part_00